MQKTSIDKRINNFSYKSIDQLIELDSALNSDLNKIMLIREGIDSKVLQDISAYIQIPQILLLKMLKIPESTYMNMKKKKEKFKPKDTELVMKLVELFKEGMKTFKSKEKFSEWMQLYVPALQGKPLDFIDTVLGVNLAIAEVVKIRYGDVA